MVTHVALGRPTLGVAPWATHRPTHVTSSTGTALASHVDIALQCVRFAGGQISGSPRLHAVQQLQVEVPEAHLVTPGVLLPPGVSRKKRKQRGPSIGRAVVEAS